MVVFTICSLLYFRHCQPYSLFFKEQAQLYLFTAEHFLSYLDKPAWAARNLGEFLTQFFFLRDGGAITITLLLLTEWLLLFRLFLKLRVGSMTPYFALLPVLMEWLLLCSPDYSLSYTVAFILFLFSFLLYRLVSNHTWISIVIGLTLSGSLYSLLGGISLLFPLFVILYERRKLAARWWYWMLLAATSLATPLFMRHLYLLPTSQLFLYPCIHVSQYLPAFLLLPLLVASTSREIQRMSLTFRSFGISLLSVAIILLIGLYIQTDKEREQILALSCETYFNNREKTAQLVAENRLPNKVATYYSNIELARQGQLPERLFSYYQPGSEGLFLHVRPSSSWMEICFSSDVYFLLGDMTMAQHSAMLGMIFSPLQRSSRMVRRLAEINIINGDLPAATKYLRILKATLFHRHWAEQQLTIVSDTTAHAEATAIKQPLPAPIDRIRFPEEHETGLLLLLEKDSQNSVALHYYLCYALLNKDISSFMTGYSRYWDKNEPLPRLYGEALLMALAAAGTKADRIRRYGIDESLMSDFQSYATLQETAAGDPEPLREQFGKSYWFYYHYVDKKRQ